LGCIQFDPDVAPFPVVNFVGRHIAQDVLGAKFSVDQIDIVIQLIEIVREKSSSPCRTDDTLDFRSAVSQFAFLSNRINLNVGFLRKVTDFAGGVP
jgi:hypothetical protein